MIRSLNRSGIDRAIILLAVVLTYGLFRGVNSAYAADAAVAAPADPAAAAAAEKEKQAWHGDLSLGFSMTRGNSKTLTLNGAVTASKLLPRDEFRLGLDGAYGLNNWGDNNEEINVENIHGFTDYKRLLTDRFYVELRVDALHDDVASVQNREIVGPSIGYYLIKEDDRRFNVGAGGAYEHQRQNHTDSNFGVVRFNERFEQNWEKKVKIWEQIEYLPKIDDFSQYLIIGEAGVEVAMNKHMSLRVLFSDTYNSKPASGKVPNDMALVSSIVYHY